MSARAGIGLTKLTTEELEELLRALYRGHLRYPLRMSDLIGTGFPHIAEKAEVLQGLDERGLRVLVTCVIAERRAQQQREEQRRSAAESGDDR